MSNRYIFVDFLYVNSHRTGRVITNRLTRSGMHESGSRLIKKVTRRLILVLFPNWTLENLSFSTLHPFQLNVAIWQNHFKILLGVIICSSFDNSINNERHFSINACVFKEDKVIAWIKKLFSHHLPRGRPNRNNLFSIWTKLLSRKHLAVHFSLRICYLVYS